MVHVDEDGVISHIEETPERLKQEVKKSMTLSELLKLNIVKVPMLWEPFLPQNGVSVLAGSSDCGKSTILRQLATSICRGDTTFLDYPLVSRHQRAIVVATEDDQYGVAASFSKQLSGQEVDYGERLHFIFDSANAVKEVEEILKNTPADLVVIDSWSDTFEGNPNDFSSVRKSIERWNVLAKKYECNISLMHHTVKNSEKQTPDKNKLNGSQGIEAKSRTLLELRHGKDSSERLLTILKGNYVSDEVKSKSIVLKFDSKSLTFSNAGTTLDNQLEVNLKPKGSSFNWVKPEALKLKVEKLLSFERLRIELVNKYGESKIPSVTWLKENL